MIPFVLTCWFFDQEHDNQSWTVLSYMTNPIDHSAIIDMCSSSIDDRHVELDLMHNNAAMISFDDLQHTMYVTLNISAYFSFVYSIERECQTVMILIVYTAIVV
jgi:hypothetical protein